MREKASIWIVALCVMGLMFQCNEDPMINEVDEFTATYRVDSIRMVNYQTNVSTLFKEEAGFILKPRQETDTISANGITQIIEPGYDENKFYLTKNLFFLEFVKKFSNNSTYSFEDAGKYYLAYWFPDLNQKRLTFWTFTGVGQYRVVLTVEGGSDSRQTWTYVRAQELGTSATNSALLYKEVVYVTRL